MRDVVNRLGSLSRYCDHLSRGLLDRGMAKRLSDAARYFEQQADALQAESNEDDPGFAASPFPPRRHP